MGKPLVTNVASRIEFFNSMAPKNGPETLPGGQKPPVQPLKKGALQSEGTDIPPSYDEVVNLATYVRVEEEGEFVPLIASAPPLSRSNSSNILNPIDKDEKLDVRKYGVYVNIYLLENHSVKEISSALDGMDAAEIKEYLTPKNSFFNSQKKIFKQKGESARKLIDVIMNCKNLSINPTFRTKN